MRRLSCLAGPVSNLAPMDQPNSGIRSLYRCPNRSLCESPPGMFRLMRTGGSTPLATIHWTASAIVAWISDTDAKVEAGPMG